LPTTLAAAGGSRIPVADRANLAPEAPSLLVGGTGFALSGGSVAAIRKSTTDTLASPIFYFENFCGLTQNLFANRFGRD
jgi:hypothetical protein